MDPLVFKPVDGFQKTFLRRLLLRVIPMLLAGSVTGLAISYFTCDDKESSLNTLPYIIPLFAIILVISTYFSAKRQQAMFESFKLIISDNLITRSQDGLPELSVYHNEVREIIRSNKGGMVIRGAQQEDVIIVPYFLERQDELQAALGRICPVTEFKVTTRTRLYKLLPVAMLVLMFSLFTIHNKAVTFTTGPALTLILLYSWRSIRQNKNLDLRIKRSANLVLLLVAVVVMVMLATILGYR